MMRTHGRATLHRFLLASVLAACIGASSLAAQTPAKCANVLTLGDVLQGLGAAARIGNLSTASPEAMHSLDVLTSSFETQHVTSLPLCQVRDELEFRADDGRNIPFHIVDRERPGARTQSFRSGIFLLNNIGNAQVVPAIRATSLPTDSVNRLLAPFDTLVKMTRGAAEARNADALARFERKYGPGSPQLNYAEVGLNYLLQFVPFLRTTESGGPSPFEVIAAYNTLALKVNDSTGAVAHSVATARLGLRVYLFGSAWGQQGRFSRYLRPSHFAVGLLSTGPKEDPLQRAWGHGARLGPFVGWGDLFASYVVGANHGLVVGTQKFIIPRVF